MKRFSNRAVVISIVSLLSFAMIGTILFLFVFDGNKPRIYQPQVDYRLLQNEIERIDSFGEDFEGEEIVLQGEFKGIIAYSRSESSVAEIKDYFLYLSRNPYYGTHIAFPNDEYEIFISEARYTPIVKTWGYGWLHYKGNLYAQQNGRDAAKGKPNFRNCFNFTVRKSDEQFVFIVYCNTSDAGEALSKAVSCINAR